MADMMDEVMDESKDWTPREKHFKVFERYMGVLKGRAGKYFIPGSSNYHDKKIKKFMELYKIPIPFEEVVIFLDTTVFRSAKEGFLFTTEGVVVKMDMDKLTFLSFAKMEKAELEEIKDPDTAIVTEKILVTFKDGTTKHVLDYDIRKNFFVDYLNDALEQYKNP